MSAAVLIAAGTASLTSPGVRATLRHSVHRLTESPAERVRGFMEPAASQHRTR